MTEYTGTKKLITDFMKCRVEFYTSIDGSKMVRWKEHNGDQTDTVINLGKRIIAHKKSVLAMDARIAKKKS